MSLPVVLNDFEKARRTCTRHDLPLGWLRLTGSKVPEGRATRGRTMDIYTFDKCLQERLMEYKSILFNPGKIVPASQIRSEWACDLDVVIEPVGWQALWNVSRPACEDLSIHYPTVILVEVLSIDCPALTALVKIVAVQDDIHLPEKHNVPLLRLYPTIEQSNTSLDIVGTAHCVDRLRFFYNHLWMPWDQDDDENADWVEQHLESRIRLAYDMRRGIIDKDTCDHIKSLVKEAREIEKKIAALEDEMPDEIEEEIQDKVTDEACRLMKLHFRLQQIKSEMEMLENPVIREMLMKNQSLIDERRSRVDRKDKKNIAHFVWLEGTVKELHTACDRIQEMEDKGLTIKVHEHLDEVLRTSEAGDIVLLGQGAHEIRSVSGLEEGGTIRGINDRDSTIICPKELGGALALLDFSGVVTLDNICIDLGELQVGLIARKGTVKVNGCRVRDLSRSSVKLGMVVMPGAKLIIEDSTFQGLGTAAVAYGTGELVMRDCRFQDCADGVQLCDNANFTATECVFENLKQYGIRMETQKYITGTESKLGCSELLTDVSEVNLLNCRFSNNAEADVALKPKSIVALGERQEMVS